MGSGIVSRIREGLEFTGACIKETGGLVRCGGSCRGGGRRVVFKRGGGEGLGCEVDLDNTTLSLFHLPEGGGGGIEIDDDDAPSIADAEVDDA